jgi:hypothetical protein
MDPEEKAHGRGSPGICPGPAKSWGCIAIGGDKNAVAECWWGTMKHMQVLVLVFVDQGSLGSCAIECWGAVRDVGTAGEARDASYC